MSKCASYLYECQGHNEHEIVTQIPFETDILKSQSGSQNPWNQSNKISLITVNKQNYYLLISLKTAMFL